MMIKLLLNDLATGGAIKTEHDTPEPGPSPDKMLQGRLFSYGDTQRYRLGINHTSLPVNCPHAAKASSYARDGAMRFDGNEGRAKNYEPNSVEGPVQSNVPLSAPLEMHGLSGSWPNEPHAEDSDFVQAGDLYRLMTEAEKVRLVDNIAAGLSAVSRPEIVTRSISHFRNADPDYGERIDRAVKALRPENVGAEVTVQTSEATE